MLSYFHRKPAPKKRTAKEENTLEQQIDRSLASIPSSSHFYCEIGQMKLLEQHKTKLMGQQIVKSTLNVFFVVYFFFSP